MTQVDKPTFTEATESLTGWDELAIEKASGYTVEQMADQGKPRALQLTRCIAAVFVSRAKQMPYADAYREVMGWPQTQVQGMFGDEPADVMPDDPDSDSGKGGPRPGDGPTTWPSSALPPE
jgi:hypothetical protein